MNFRTIWGVFGRQRTWNRMRNCWRTNLRTRSGMCVMNKYPRTTLLLSFTGFYNISQPHHPHLECTVDDSYLQGLSKELGELERLKNATLICKHCRQRLLIDKPVDGKVYCKCAKNIALVDETTGWQPFLESKDIIIWRREEKPGSGLHEYKVYGRYEEVTAEDFLSMHTDLVYWRSWDDTALTVKKLPPPNTSLQNHNQEIIYWETLWPRFFANRDYVYVRRHAYMNVDYKDIPPAHEWHCSLHQSGDKCSNNCASLPPHKSKHNDDDYGHQTMEHTQNNPEHVRNVKEIGNFINSHLNQDKTCLKKKMVKIIVLTSQSCEHPDAPLTSKAHRVKRYRSDLVIKPFTDLDKPGIEFSLTYFDDPGTSIPSALQSWVAGHACPEFLHKMRLAAANYQKPLQETHNKVYDTKDTIAPMAVSSRQLSQVGDKDSTLLPSEDNKVIISSENVKLNKQLAYKQKTQQETEELLCLLNGEVRCKPNGDSEGSLKEVKREVGKDGPEEVKKEVGKDGGEQQEKQRECHQQGMSYWNIWPLYYFA